MYQSTLTNTSPPYYACSCSYYLSFSFSAFQDSLSISSLKDHTGLNCTPKLASSYTYSPAHLHTNCKHVNREYTIAGLLQHTRCH